MKSSVLPLQTIGQKVDSTISSVTGYVKENTKAAAPSSQSDTPTTFQKATDVVSNALGYSQNKANESGNVAQDKAQAAQDTTGSLYQQVKLQQRKF